MRLRVAPEVVARLCAQWAELDAGFYVGGEDANAVGLRSVEDVRALAERPSVVETRTVVTAGTCTRCDAPSVSVCAECYSALLRRAFAHGITGNVSRVERRARDDGTREVRLVLGDCDVENRATKRSMGGCALTTEWEPEGGRFHWSHVFQEESAEQSANE